VLLFLRVTGGGFVQQEATGAGSRKIWAAAGRQPASQQQEQPGRQAASQQQEQAA